MEIVDPRNFFVSNEEILKCKQKYESFKMREEIAKNLNSKIYIDPNEKEELIHAWKIYNSSIHPDTGEIMPFYFKMSGFVLFNTPILFGTILV